MTQPLILLLEDNPDDADLMRIALQECHFGGDLVVLENGQETLDFVYGEGSHAGRPYRPGPLLILIDLKLPGLSGLEVLRILKSDPRSRHFPAVVLSTSEVRSDVHQAYEFGANAYLRKPVTLGSFIAVVGSLIRFWFSPDLVQKEGG